MRLVVVLAIGSGDFFPASAFGGYVLDGVSGGSLHGLGWVGLGWVEGWVW